jgi:hypothetical protein
MPTVKNKKPGSDWPPGSFLFVVVYNVIQHLFHQVHPVFAHHIVFVHRVREKVNLFPSLYEFLDEHEVMLHYHHIIAGSMNQEQFPLRSFT